MEKAKKIEYAISSIVIMLLLIVAVVGKRTPVKGNEKETETCTTSYSVLAVETATKETVIVNTVAVTEPTTESIELYDVPLNDDLQRYIIGLCDKANIAPALVMAIIERESDFDPLNVGDNGNSLGLMQIQPKWHQWRMDELGGGDWFNPYDNVKVGIHILEDLFHKYGDNVYMVLMAYNGGCSYAEKKAEQGIYSDYAVEVDARAEALEHIEEEQSNEF